MTERIIRRLDEYLAKNDYAAAEKHLLYWLEQSSCEADRRITLLVCNELMGLYRKTGKKNEALEFASRALETIFEMKIEENVGAATTYINCATVYKAFGRAEEAIPLFEKARQIYERELAPQDSRLGGLYNNMALALADLRSFDDAFGYYRKALDVMLSGDTGRAEAAITYLNMASAAELRDGAEAAEELIGEYIHSAMSLLDADKQRADGAYAFACEKCAGVFGYYGYFRYEGELKERSRRIYEGT